jgi:tRNA 2-thiouridine synthesizing protein E
VAAVLDGVGFTAEGHLADPAAWTRALAENIAAAQAVDLGAEHWRVVEFARAEFEKTGASPNVRRITQGAAITTKDLYALFPRAPARTVARIAGIPKPAGCI